MRYSQEQTNLSSSDFSGLCALLDDRGQSANADFTIQAMNRSGYVAIAIFYVTSGLIVARFHGAGTGNTGVLRRRTEG